MWGRDDAKKRKKIDFFFVAHDLGAFPPPPWDYRITADLE